MNKSTLGENIYKLQYSNPGVSQLELVRIWKKKKVI